MLDLFTVTRRDTFGRSTRTPNWEALSIAFLGTALITTFVAFYDFFVIGVKLAHRIASM